LSRLADYLLAARQAIMWKVALGSKKAGPPNDNASLDYQRRLSQLADSCQLDRVVLGGWVDFLLKAKQDVNDPLYPWAKISDDTNIINRYATNIIWFPNSGLGASSVETPVRSSPVRDSKQSFAECVPKQSLGTRSTRGGIGGLESNSNRKRLG